MMEKMNFSSVLNHSKQQSQNLAHLSKLGLSYPPKVTPLSEQEKAEQDEHVISDDENSLNVEENSS